MNSEGWDNVKFIEPEEPEVPDFIHPGGFFCALCDYRLGKDSMSSHWECAKIPDYRGNFSPTTVVIKAFRGQKVKDCPMYYPRRPRSSWFSRLVNWIRR